MSEPLQTPQAERQAAAMRLAARDAGIKGQAKREGREERERELMQELGIRTIEDLGILSQVRFEHEAALKQQEGRWRVIERKHGLFRLWQGIAIGASLGAIAAGAGTYAVIDGGQKAAFDAAADSAARNVVTGYALQRTQDEPSSPALTPEQQ